MIKLPEQCNLALVSNYQGQGEYRNLSYEHCDTTAKYSEKQMRQAIRDALEEALNCYSQDDTATDYLDKIFELKESV
jgi:predicted component of type VI protein secretion system